MPRKVLFIAYFFPPLGGGGVQRTSKFVKYLPVLGWSPVVVTVRPGAYWVTDGTLGEDVPSEAEVVRTRSISFFGLLGRLPGGGKGTRTGERAGQRSGLLFRFLRKLSSFLLVPDSYVGWVPFATAAVMKRLRRRDVSVVYSTSSPDSAHLAALAAKWVGKKPWIADFRDPWTERVTFSAPTPLHLALHRFLERLVLRYADRIVCTSQEMVGDFLRKYPGLEPRKFSVITNGFDPDDFTPGELLRDKFTVSHTGILTGKRNCFGFLEGLKLFLMDNPDARTRTSVLFVGTRDRENEFRTRELGLADVVRFEDTLPHRECVRIQSGSHVLLLMEDESYAGSLIYPAKVFEYAATGRPILALVPEGPAARFVRELRAGLVVSASDARLVAEALDFYYSKYSSKEPFQGVSDRGLLRPFERLNLTRRLSSLLDELQKHTHDSLHVQ